MESGGGVKNVIFFVAIKTMLVIIAIEDPLLAKVDFEFRCCAKPRKIPL